MTPADFRATPLYSGGIPLCRTHPTWPRLMRRMSSVRPLSRDQLPGARVAAIQGK